jgi:hypothetical protein
MLVNPEITIYYQKGLQKTGGDDFQKMYLRCRKTSDEQDIVFFSKTIFVIVVALSSWNECPLWLFSRALFCRHICRYYL